VPEFAGGDDFTAIPVRRLAALWLLGRAAFWTSGLFGSAALALAGAAHLALLGGLALLAAPRLWRDPERKHLAFLWALTGFAVVRRRLRISTRCAASIPPAGCTPPSACS